MSDKTNQVQIRVMGPDGEWFQPAYQVQAVLAALPAIHEDIEHYSGSYGDSDLRKIRAALRELDAAITRRIGP